MYGERQFVLHRGKKRLRGFRLRAVIHRSQGRQRPDDSDLLDPTRFPVFDTQRGGQFTYHGPGQRVAYVMLDLTKRGRDVKQFVCSLEDWIIQTLATFNVKGERRKGRVGVWVDRTQSGGQLREDKIAAIGVRLKRWVSYHGISLNVDPDLTHFGGITPCGISEDGLGVTSLHAPTTPPASATRRCSTSSGATPSGWRRCARSAPGCTSSSATASCRARWWSRTRRRDDHLP